VQNKLTGVLLAVAGVMIVAPVAAQDFYRGKTINLIVGNAPGGGYDHYARLLARVMPRYIPGEPGMVVRNMPGAGGMVMSNHMYSQAPRDGLTFVHLTASDVDRSARGKLLTRPQKSSPQQAVRICRVAHSVRVRPVV
jgi:tripartite-type tricarboxylate transporter receptor subunit TctC